jgi:hypothetical protein
VDLANGGHIPVLDKHRAAFTQAVLAFLRGEWETE